MRDLQSEIVAAIAPGESLTSDEIAHRLGVERNYILQDLSALTVEKRLRRQKCTRPKGGLFYLYSQPARAPWSDWPSWCLISDLPTCWK